MSSFISIRGARTHNLKNIDVDIPRGKLVVITGVSGSGKSSLAFDTLFAEGQRQFIQSLSAYSRQFFDQLPRPDVDRIDGLSPTIAIDQRPAAPNPRSTVATITEIHDYLRVLMARAGDVNCPTCDTPISQQTPAQIEEAIRTLPESARIMLLAPIVRGRKGAHRDAFEAIQKAGFVRARVDGVIHALEEVPALAPQQTHDVEAVVDRIVLRAGVDARLSESIRLALRHGDGVVIVLHQSPDAQSGDTWQERIHNTRYACPRCGSSIGEIEPRTFSFNSPYGACPACGGLGAITDNEDKETGRQGDKEKEHAVQLSLSPGLPDSRSSSACPACHGTRLRPEARAVRLRGLAVHEITGLTVTAAVEFFGRLRLSANHAPIAQPLLTQITHRLEFLLRVGVDYLTLDRPADTLSGGERQRVRLATGLGAGLVGILYLLDEPSIGLHARDTDRLIAALRDLVRQGNSVIVVEHDEAIIRAAEHLIEIGPAAGPNGGRVVAQGTPEEVAESEASLTGAYLSSRRTIDNPRRRRSVPITNDEFRMTNEEKDNSSFVICHSSFLKLTGATANNLQNLTVTIPLNAFVCVTGVSGSGKSTLVLDTLAPAIAHALAKRHQDKETGRQGDKETENVEFLMTNDESGAGHSSFVICHSSFENSSLSPGLLVSPSSAITRLIQIDSSPIGRTPRASAATYTGLWNDVRRLFAATKTARQRGYRTSRFSASVKGGRCEECKGAGVKRIAMNFLPNLEVTCPACRGRRFNPPTLAVRFLGKSIADVLEMSVDEAAGFFVNHAAIHRVLTVLADVGLGYLALGQPATTLSGGEAQRIKLAAELARPALGQTLYILDEPTTGLATDDIRRLLAVLHRLVDQGHSIIVIEHNLDVIKTADWIIDLGPEGGAGGGRLVAKGPPAQIAASEASHTGRFLRARLSEESVRQYTKAQGE